MTITDDQVNAAGWAYWNYYRQKRGQSMDKFKLDKDFAAAMRAALEAALEARDDQ